MLFWNVRIATNWVIVCQCKRPRMECNKSIAVTMDTDDRCHYWDIYIYIYIVTDIGFGRVIWILFWWWLSCNELGYRFSQCKRPRMECNTCRRVGPDEEHCRVYKETKPTVKLIHSSDTVPLCGPTVPMCGRTFQPSPSVDVPSSCVDAPQNYHSQYTRHHIVSEDTLAE
jgi:hypothetical protein